LAKHLSRRHLNQFYKAEGGRQTPRGARWSP
jgi:hypothetical protein